jgi:hypothetical protein
MKMTVRIPMQVDQPSRIKKFSDNIYRLIVASVYLWIIFQLWVHRHDEGIIMSESILYGALLFFAYPALRICKEVIYLLLGINDDTESH